MNVLEFLKLIFVYETIGLIVFFTFGIIAYLIGSTFIYGISILTLIVGIIIWIYTIYLILRSIEID